MTTEKEELPQDDGDIADFDDTAASTKPEDAAPEPEPAKVEQEPEPEPSPAEPEPPAAGNPVMIPKARFDEATGALKDDLRNQTARAEALAAELAALKAGPEINYSEAIKALDDSWDNDNFDGDHAEYREQRAQLIKAESKQEALDEFKREQAERDKQKFLEDWQAAAETFVNANDIYADRAGKDFLYFNAQLKREFEDNPTGTFDGWLKAAHDYAETKAKAEGRRESPAPPANPHASRNAADAKAQASASAAPDPSAAGTGDRGRQSFPGLKDLKDKDYNALPKEVTESKSLADF